MGLAQPRFFTVRNSVFEKTAKNLPHAHFKVYLFIMRKARDRRADVTIREIADATGVSERHVKRAIRDLKERNLIFVFRVGRRNVYMLPEKNPTRREGHFFRVFNRLFDDGHAARMTHATFKVYAFLLRRGGQKAFVIYSLSDITRHTGVSPIHVRRCLRWLKEKGYILATKDQGRIIILISSLPDPYKPTPKPVNTSTRREGGEPWELRNVKDEGLSRLVRKIGIPVPTIPPGGGP